MEHIRALNAKFQEYYPGLQMSKSFEDSININFYSFFSTSQLVNFLDISCTRTDEADHALRYFCGICWKKLNNRENRDPMYTVVQKNNAHKENRVVH